MPDTVQPFMYPERHLKGPVSLVRPDGPEAAAAGPVTSACLVCAREKLVSNYLCVALWPRALGGQAAPAPFQCAQICKECRETTETQVDSAFLKSWFMQAELARAAQAFLDTQHPGPVPLTFLGTLHDFRGQEGEYCDRWAGLAGEVIYHMHRRRDDGWAGIGGSEGGTGVAIGAEEATLVLTSPSLFWSKIALASFAAQFPFAARFCVNEIAGLQGLDAGIARKRLRREIDRLTDTDNRSTLLNEGLRRDFSHRFLIKLALGTGFSLFGPDFTRTAHARALRRNFWQPHPKLLNFGDSAPVFAMTGAWALSLKVWNRVLGLIVVTPTGQRLQVAIADEPALWAPAEHAALVAGQVFIALPQRGVFAGPLSLGQCLAHQAGEGTCDAVEQIESLRVPQRQLPSKQGFA